MEIIKKLEITEQDLADLMVTAFEGGINYWCGKVEIHKNPANKDWASDVVAWDGQLALWDVEDPNEVWWLTREKLLKGVSKAMDHFEYATVEQMMDEHDATTADVIVQYALFDEIVFGFLSPN